MRVNGPFISTTRVHGPFVGIMRVLDTHAGVVDTRKEGRRAALHPWGFRDNVRELVIKEVEANNRKEPFQALVSGLSVRGLSVRGLSVGSLSRGKHSKGAFPRQSAGMGSLV